MRDSLLTNILLIVLLALFVGSLVYNAVFINKVAEETSKAAGGGEEEKGFTGNPSTLARKIVRK